MLLPTTPSTTTRNNNLTTTNSSLYTPLSSRYDSRDLFQRNESADSFLDLENNNFQSTLNDPIEDNNNNFVEQQYNNNNNNSDYNISIIPKRRPPLNRAIPPIPESKSNESIISAQSNFTNRRLNSNRAVILNTNKNLETGKKLISSKSSNSISIIFSLILK